MWDRERLYVSLSDKFYPNIKTIKNASFVQNLFDYNINYTGDLVSSTDMHLLVNALTEKPSQCAIQRRLFSAR